MALATRCPHCKTAFRVANDQLKLRGGLVRCGQCKEIFNGIENLLPADATQRPATSSIDPAPFPKPQPLAGQTSPVSPVTTPATPAIPSASSVAPHSAAVPPAVHSAEDTSAASSDPGGESAATPDAAPPIDPLLRMTLLDFAARDDDTDESPGQGDAQDTGAASPARRAAHASPADQHDPIDAAIAAIAASPARSPGRAPWNMLRGRGRQKDEDEEQEDDEREDDHDREPGFVIEGRRKSRRAARTAWLTLAAVLLGFALLAQIAYAMRSSILSRFPQSAPVLASACRVLGCELSLPTETDALLIESSDLQSTVAGSDILALSFLLRNRSSSTQAWPSIELTMNDANDKPLARKVFAPRDYLHAAAAVDAGIPADREHAAKILFRFTGPKASGYRIYLFYP
ncbi:MAG: DUF3426 domain-containing protein [Burkholderiaceae bacterium]